MQPSTQIRASFPTALMLSCLFFILLITTTTGHLGGRRIDEHDREHLRGHYQGELDLSRLSEQEMRILYFQSHDSESNDRLDGIELVQSLLHYHLEESTLHGEPSRVFTDSELSLMVDSLLDLADRNADGFIDYPEFVAGQTVKKT